MILLSGNPAEGPAPGPGGSSPGRSPGPQRRTFPPRSRFGRSGAARRASNRAATLCGTRAAQVMGKFPHFLLCPRW